MNAIEIWQLLALNFKCDFGKKIMGINVSTKDID